MWEPHKEGIDWFPTRRADGHAIRAVRFNSADDCQVQCDAYNAGEEHRARQEGTGEP